MKIKKNVSFQNFNLLLWFDGNAKRKKALWLLQVNWSWVGYLHT